MHENDIPNESEQEQKSIDEVYLVQEQANKYKNKDLLLAGVGILT